MPLKGVEELEALRAKGDLASLEAAVTQGEALQAEWAAATTALEQQLTDTTASAEAAEKNVADLKKNVEDAKKALAAAAPAPVPTAAATAADSGEFLEHVRECIELEEALQGHLAAFQHAQKIIDAAAQTDAAPFNLRYANASAAVRCEQGWGAFDARLDSRIRALVAKEAAFAADGADAAASGPLAALAEQVRAAHKAVVGPLSREAARCSSSTKGIDDLRASQASIVLWCRQQRSTLESLTEPAHLLEYTNSFQTNISVMETNFLVLMELAEPLLPSPDAQVLITEAVEVWLGLQVFVFERVTGTLAQQHKASGLEEAVSRWTAHAPQVQSFLEAARTLLEMPTDDESRAVTQPLLDSCISLAGDIESFSVITDHLSSFTLRDSTLEAFYAAIRRSIFSKLTLTTQAYNTQFEFDRKAEYMDRLAELNDWVDCKSQGGAWRQLLERVQRMKQLISDNEALHGTGENINNNSNLTGNAY